MKHDEAYRHILYGSDTLSAVGSWVQNLDHVKGWSGLPTFGTNAAFLGRYISCLSNKPKFAKRHVALIGPSSVMRALSYS